MIEIPLRRRDGTLHGFALIDDEDAHLAEHRWSLATSTGYVVRNVTRADGRRTQVLLHREVLGLQPGDGLQVDHIEDDKLDCRRSNLRIATPRQNAQNRHTVRSATGLRGVSFHRPSGLYQAHAVIDGRSRSAYRKTAEEAAAVAAAWRAEHMPFSREARAA